MKNGRFEWLNRSFEDGCCTSHKVAFATVFGKVRRQKMTVHRR